MGATKLSFGPGDFDKFSERELVQHFYETRNTECVTELWRRHEKTVRNAVRRRVFAGNVCPASQSHDSFAEAALSLAQFNFCRRINGFLNFRGPFELWASCIAGSAVLDELKAASRFKEIPVSSLESDGQTASESEDVTTRWRSEHLEPGAGLSLPPQHKDAPIVAEQRKSVVLRMLVAHASASQDGLDSAQSIRLRYWNDWTLAKIGERLYGLQDSDRERNRQEVAVRRLLADDYEKLRVLLKEEFGIAEFLHI